MPPAVKMAAPRAPEGGALVGEVVVVQALRNRRDEEVDADERRHQHMAEMALVASARARGQSGKFLRHIQSLHLRGQLAIDIGWRLQVAEKYFAAVVLCVTGKQAALETDKTESDICTHGRAQHTAGVSTQARGNIHCQHRKTTGIDGGNRFLECGPHFALEASTQQTVDNHASFRHLPLPALYINTCRFGPLAGEQGVALCRGVAYLPQLHAVTALTSKSGQQAGITGIVTLAAEQV